MKINNSQNLKRGGKVLAAAAAFTALLLFPPIHAILVLINFIAHLVVLSIQWITSLLPRPALHERELPQSEPFISIHVPAHNEPPELLKETLRSLSRLRYQNYEVIVIDNNTTDEALWRPIEEYCIQLGRKFRFFHVENLAGYKAGALNYIRPHIDPRAEYVFVVDADYVVNRNALRRGLAYFTDPKVGLVQFPQDYRNIGRGNLGIALDFKHFFSGYMTMANVLNCVPSTGTLSFISLRALRTLDGFDTHVITEDADLGLRLSLKGFRAVFVNEVIGQGVMPYDLESLKKQRWRWAFGNAQILKLNWRALLLGRQLNWRQKLGYMSHLTAWFNFNLIPSLSLISLAPVALFGRPTPVQHSIIQISAFTLLSFLILRFGTIYRSLRRDGHTLREIGLAYLTHVGLGWIFSASWIKCLIDHRSPFIRTNKFIGRLMPGPLQNTIAELGMGAALLLTAGLLVFTDYVFGPVAALVMCSARFLVYWVWRQTETTWRLSRQMFEPRTPGSAFSSAPLPVVGTAPLIAEPPQTAEAA
jgi:cellulose synthase/poly-beta-1,6-N-acetylglucosamine synthase-like glycosyltransferase